MRYTGAMHVSGSNEDSHLLFCVCLTCLVFMLVCFRELCFPLYASYVLCNVRGFGPAFTCALCLRVYGVGVVWFAGARSRTEEP